MKFKIVISEKESPIYVNGFFAKTKDHLTPTKKYFADGISCPQSKEFFPKPIIKNWENL